MLMWETILATAKKYLSNSKFQVIQDLFKPPYSPKIIMKPLTDTELLPFLL